MRRRPRKCPCNWFFNFRTIGFYYEFEEKLFSPILKVWKINYRDIFSADGTYLETPEIKPAQNTVTKKEFLSYV